MLCTVPIHPLINTGRLPFAAEQFEEVEFKFNPKPRLIIRDTRVRLFR